MEGPDRYLVAHRGDRDGGHENSMAAFSHAVASGAAYLEGDLQLTADAVAVMRHDATDEACSTLRVQEPWLVTVNELLNWLEGQLITFFLELKQEILEVGPAAELLEKLLPEILPARLVLISYSSLLLEAAHRLWPDTAIGWVYEAGRDPPSCAPAFVFCAQNELTAVAERWQASVRIVCYTVNRAADVPELLAAGADLVETDYFTRMRGELSHADASI